MPHKIWTGTLSFVLVSIPIDLVSAVRRDRVSFRMLHKTDHTPLQRRMYCPKDKTFVHGEHIVNGYPVGENQFVIVREEEYKALEPKRNQSIEIDHFVNYEDIESIYFERPYYILPRKGGSKSYQMLKAVMQETGKAGIAKFVLHTREHLVVVRAVDNILELMTLHFSEQIRDKSELLPSVKAQSSKVKALISQINQRKSRYDPAGYTDDHRRHILEYLEEKARQGKTVTIEHPEEEAEQPEPESETDLVAALEKSLSKAKSR